MATHVSRRHIAAYCAEELLNGNQAVLKELAAYLVSERRVREWELVVRDIEGALAQRGVVIADVAAARGLNDTARHAIKAFVAAKLDAKEVYLRETIEDDLLGGIRMSTPGGQMDASVRRKLMTLRASKV
jgi:F0F1-type ATP synthase delta subunit